MKRCNLIKRFFIGLLLIVVASISANAQEGLYVKSIFQRFGHAKGCKMVTMQNAQLKGYRLKIYKSLVYKNHATEIAHYLKADRKAAKKIREVVENGKMVSGYYMMAPLSNGNNRFILFSNPNKSKGTVIYIEGYLLVNEELVRTTMQKAKKLGLKVALDLSNFNIVNAFKGMLEDIIPKYVDILFSNESEAEAFTGQKAAEAVHTLSDLVEVSLVTLGKEGALIGSHGQFYSVPAEGGKPVDTTGAGDNFAAGFLYGQSIGASLVQSARIGSMLAGYVIDVVGPEIPYDKWEQIKLKVKGILA